MTVAAETRVLPRSAAYRSHPRARGRPAAHVVAAMLSHATVATTLRLYAHVTHASTEALVDAIDARFGPRLGVLPEEVLDQYWTKKVEIGSTATESECRERCRVSRHIGRMSQDIVDTHVWRGCRYGSGALCGGRGAARGAQPH